VSHLLSQSSETLLEHRCLYKDKKFYDCDLTDYAAVKQVVKKIISDYGRIDIVIENGLQSHTPNENDDQITGFLHQTSYGVLAFLQVE
jgi:NAD(P)-dependent dehydrogenase (short-subunit alcohol dehydrogenase family)